MKRKLIDKTILKFMLIGVCNTFIGCGTMFLLYNFAGCSYWISSIANYVIGGTFSFFLNKYFTFQNKERSLRQVGRFIVNVAVCYIIAYGMAKPAVAILMSHQMQALQENAAMLAGMCLYTGLNYLGQRFFAFK